MLLEFYSLIDKIFHFVIYFKTYILNAVCCLIELNIMRQIQIRYLVYCTFLLLCCKILLF